MMVWIRLLVVLCKMNFVLRLCLICALLCFPFSFARAAATVDYPIVKLRSLDKISARTSIFEAHVGSTVRFGQVYIKVQACRKSPEFEQPESAAFLQVWEVRAGDAGAEEQPEWIFSGWMFASSPGLSSMDHPIYDVWVLDCLAEKGQETDKTSSPTTEDPAKGDVKGDVKPPEGQ